MMTINYHITSLRVCWKIFRTRGNFNMWTSRAYFKSSKRAPISWNLKVKNPLTLFKMGEAKRCSQTVFPLLICSFTFLPHWCKISRPYLVLVPNYWNQEHLSNKKKFFSSNPYKIQVIITSLIEMLSNFGHMTTFIRYLSHVIKICWWRHGQKFWRIIFILKYLYFQKN